jgi:hypothetical protein
MDRTHPYLRERETKLIFLDDSYEFTGTSLNPIQCSVRCRTVEREGENLLQWSEQLSFEKCFCGKLTIGFRVCR